MRKRRTLSRRAVGMGAIAALSGVSITRAAASSIIDARASPDGSSVVFTISPPGPVNVPAREVGQFVTGILGAAVESSKKTGQVAHLKLHETDRKKLIYVAAHEVAIGSALDKPDLVTLVFAVGATELTLGIPRVILKTLGEAMLKAAG